MTALNADRIGFIVMTTFAAVSLAAGVLVTVAGAHLEQLRRQRRARAQRPVRVPGVQPVEEFIGGPTGHGLLFHDALLAEVVGAWERELGAGGRS